MKSKRRTGGAPGELTPEWFRAWLKTQPLRVRRRHSDLLRRRVRERQRLRDGRSWYDKHVTRLEVEAWLATLTALPLTSPPETP